MIDPHLNSTRLLQKNCIPACLIDALVVTHCHADHDAGTFQKILQEGRVTLITTPTIMGCFLRKYSALAGFDVGFLKTVFKFKPVRIGEKLNFHGGCLNFFYTLHSIPCVGFEAFYGEKSIVFSADHMNDPFKINQLYEQGVLTKARRDDLLSFPWHHDLILHESGVPPIHTPIETLVSLDEDIKRRMYLVHVAASSIPENSGLKFAKPGVENTIVIENVIPPNYSEELLKIDLVTGIAMFQDLKLANAGEIFSSAEVVKYEEGEYIVEKGEEADSFYIIQSGVAEVKVERTRSLGFVDDDEDLAFLSRKLTEDDLSLSTKSRSRALSESVLTEFSTPQRRMSELNHERYTDLKKSGSVVNPDFKRTGKKRNFSRRSKSRSHMSNFGGDSLDFNMNNNRNLTLRTFYAGDYFGENALISDFALRNANIVCLTDVTAIRFEKQSFLAVLEDTDVVKKLRHLATMRERGTWDTLESNSMLRLLSTGQKTQLETYFVRKRFENNQIIWNENDDCEFAFLVHGGNVTYTEPKALYKRRGSGVHVDMNVLYDEIRGESVSNSQSSSKPLLKLPKIGEVSNGSLTNSDLDSTLYTHLHRNDPDLAAEHGKQVNDEVLEESAFDSQNLVFKKGAFLGDVDGLFYSGKNKVGVKAIGEVTVLCLMKEDIQRFFKNNPGVLLSMMHTQFIV